MTILRIRGIPIRLHSSFLVLAGGLVLWQLVAEGAAAAVTGLLLGVVVFGSVLLHELGHALAGRGFGLRTRDITLYPFGGVAAMEVPATRPTVELIVAVAGPAVNAGLALFGLLLLRLGVPFASEVLAINAMLGIFNLLPAYPMDGGRVLRAWWTMRDGPVVATLKALRVSRWFAWGMVGLGLMMRSSLLLVGLFLLYATSNERRRWQTLARQIGAMTDSRGFPPSTAAPSTRPSAAGGWSHPTR